jgi:hypothetical protein
MLSTAWKRTDPFWTAWSSDNANWLRLTATAETDGAPFTKEFLEDQRQILGEQDFKQEYLGIPGGGIASPFDWELYARATTYHAPLVPSGPAIARPSSPDPARWPIQYPIIAHDVGRTHDRSTAVVGGYCRLIPEALGVAEITELRQNCFGHQLASELAVVDSRYHRNAVIVADLSNDRSYAEALYEVFGKRVVGVQIGRFGEGLEFERLPMGSHVIPVYHVGRTFLFDLLLREFRVNQVRLLDGPMAQRAYEQLNALEVEEKENRVIYKCLSGQHDDLGISCAMLLWAARHRDLHRFWVRPIEDRHRSRSKGKEYNWGAFVRG